MTDRDKGILMTWLLGVGLVFLAGWAVQFPPVRWFITGFAVLYATVQFFPLFCYGYGGTSTMLASITGMVLAYGFVEDGGMAVIFGATFGLFAGLYRLEQKSDNKQ